MLIRPSLKFIKLSYLACVVLAVGILVLSMTYKEYQNYLTWALILPGFFLFMTAMAHIQRRMVKLEILGDRLRYEEGLLSKTTETVDLAKVQDIRVEQSLGQRIFRMGNLSFETAGQRSRIVMHAIDNPQITADHILALAQAQRAKPESHGV